MQKFVGFDEPSDADFFLDSGRGRVPVANILGLLFFIFHDDDDAFHFVREGSGEFLSEDEARSLATQPTQEAKMLTTKPKINAVAVETKAMTPKAEATKRPAPAKAVAKAKAR